MAVDGFAGGDRAGGDRAGGDRAWSMVVPHHARGARQARQRLAAELVDLLSPAMLNDAVSVVAELLGNAVRHAHPLPGGVIRVAWRVSLAVGAGGATPQRVYVRVRVTDGGAAQPPSPRDVGPDSIDGRGLAIVSALARRWGVEPDADGQCVWAELGPAPPLDQDRKA